MYRRKLYSIILFIVFGVCLTSIKAQAYFIPLKKGDSVVPGAWRLKDYLPLLKDKKVALIINQTSMIHTTTLLDTLIKSGVHIVKVFVPEHGFRGAEEAGVTVESDTDSATRLPIISLYGDNKKPRPEQLTDVDVVVYDLQDVGARFYTYIATMQYALEACAENKKQFIILDRPNPNGHYVDGPVLKPALRSFVGMQPVPIVYGMTVGEYAKMLVGQKWLSIKPTVKVNLKVITCTHYDHNTLYVLPDRPSPNLKSMAAILSYPSICLFEGTVVSVGRGTSTPFQVWGHPMFAKKTAYSFRPVPVWGHKIDPPYAYRECFGQITAFSTDEALKMMNRRMRMLWLVRAYEWFPDKDKFFNDFFDKLAGTPDLKKQVQQGMNEDQIAATWQKDLTAFKKIRKKYLLYADFE